MWPSHFSFWTCPFVKALFTCQYDLANMVQLTPILDIFHIKNKFKASIDNHVNLTTQYGHVMLTWMKSIYF